MRTANILLHTSPVLHYLFILFLSLIVSTCGGGGSSTPSSGGGAGGSSCGTVCVVTSVYVIGPGGGFYAYPICSSTCPVVPANHQPIASISAPSTLVLGSSLTLDSSASDPDGDDLSYHWGLLSQPAASSASITDDSLADLPFTPDAVGRYLFSLVVDDGELSANTQYHIVDVESIALANFDLTTTQVATFSDSAAGVSAGQIDGDTDQDIVVGTCDGKIEALLNNGDGSFTRNTPAAAYAYCNSVPLIGKFDADGHADVASYNTLVKGDGSGGFSALTTLGFSATNIATGDFNQDGNTDLVAISALPNTAVKIMHGDGMGGFTEGYSADSPSEIVPLAVADFDNDGVDDLVYYSALFDANGDSEISILLGDSSSYATPVTVTVPGRGALGVGDINTDGNADIVISYKLGTQPNLPSGIIQNVGIGFATILGNGDGTFATPRQFDAANLSVSNIAVYDFDGDGNKDFVYRGDSYSVNVLTGDGLGGVNDVAILPVSSDFGFGFAVDEIDGDSNPDILLVGDLGNTQGELRIAYGVDNQVP